MPFGSKKWVRLMIEAYIQATLTVEVYFLTE